MSARLQAIVDGLKLKPTDSVLEIGCGQGVAADFIGRRLVGGQLLAIDRSTRMIAAARRRNAVHIAAGRAEFVVAELETFDPGDRRFDLILAIRVGLFHREPDRFYARVRPWLAPRGRVVAVYDEP